MAHFSFNFVTTRVLASSCVWFTGKIELVMHETGVTFVSHCTYTGVTFVSHRRDTGVAFVSHRTHAGVTFVSHHRHRYSHFAIKSVKPKECNVSL